MSAPFLSLPDRLPTDGSNLSELIRLLHRDQLYASEQPFSYPHELLKAAANLEYYPIRGVGRSGIPPQSPATLPSAILGGVVHAAMPFAFLTESNGQSLTISVGGATGRATNVVRGMQAMLDSPPTTPSHFKEARLLAPSYGCLFGMPALPPDPASSLVVALPRMGALDMLADGLHGEPFTYLVYATPEARGHVERTLAQLRTALTEIEQSHLLTDALARANRTARHVSELLEQEIAALERGLSDGLWRVSILLGTRDAELTARALPILVGAWRSREPTPIPLRGFACGPGPAGYSTHSNLFSSEQLALLCPLPGRDRSGFAIRDIVHFDVDHQSLAPAQVPADEIELGQILDREQPTGIQMTIDPKLLCRHGLLCGHTGSGKSTTARALLAELGRRGIPFLVIDPVKPAVVEYATLAAVIPGLCMLRVGVLPQPGAPIFQLNPLAFPRGFSLFTHLDLLKATFTACFGLVPPAPYLLESALHRAYRNRGWDTMTGQHPQPDDPLAFPTLSEVVDELDEVVNRAGYSDEVRRNLLTALRVRLGNLCIGPRGLCLNTRQGLPDEFLYDSPMIIELGALASHEEQALVMGLLLTRLIEVRKVRGLTGKEELRHLLVIEEAHRLLQNTQQRSTEEGNMAYHAIQAFAGLVAEMRAYGQGVLLVEQLPSRLAPEVVKHTCIKIVHRLTPAEDRAAVGDSMALSEEQQKHLSILRTGEAVAMQEGMDGAVLLRIAQLPGTAAAAVDWDRRWPRGHSKGLRLAQKEQQQRLRLASWLQLPAVQRAADSAVIAALASEPAEAVLKRFEQQMNEALLRTTGGRQLDPRAIAALLRTALEETVLRRYLFRGGTSAGWEPLRHLLAERPADGLTQLPKSFARLVGPHSFCSACPAPCRFGYDGLVLAKEPLYREDLLSALALPPAERAARLAAASRQVQERTLNERHLLPGPGMKALSYCTLGHGTMQLRLSPDEIESVIDACYSHLS